MFELPACKLDNDNVFCILDWQSMPAVYKKIICCFYRDLFQIRVAISGTWFGNKSLGEW